jgi:hypothetical protein
MKKFVWLMIFLGPAILYVATPALAEEFFGIIKSVKGTASIERNLESMVALQGMKLSKGDVVRTEQNSSIALVFSDDTIISMGPKTKVAIDEYLFDPLKKKLAFVARIIHGTVSFLSGQIAKLAPESVQLIMPTATIGVRGTHILIKVD